MLVVQPHLWPLGSIPVYVTFSFWARLRQLQLEVWAAEEEHLAPSTARHIQPLVMPSLPATPASSQTLVLINNSKHPTERAWQSGFDTLWVVSRGHLQIVQLWGTALLQGVRQVCIAYPCFLRNGKPGKLTVMGYKGSEQPVPLHCSFDAWLETTEVNLEQLALERFSHGGMNFIVSLGYRDTALQKYAELTDGVYAGFASDSGVTQSAAV